MPAAIHGCTIAAYGEDVLALGNQIDGQRAWILRAGADSWAPLSDAPEARLLAVGVATAAGTSKTRAFVNFGDRARVDVPVFGYVKSGDVWNWRYARNALVNTHRAPAVVAGLVSCLRAETVSGETARVQCVRVDALRWH